MDLLMYPDVSPFIAIFFHLDSEPTEWLDGVSVYKTFDLEKKV